MAGLLFGKAIGRNARRKNVYSTAVSNCRLSELGVSIPFITFWLERPTTMLITARKVTITA
jgi:hypothetical protein